MRCRNCHVQLMATDTHCPSCHSPVSRATAAAPGEMARNTDNKLWMLPAFGGLAGGLLAGAIMAAQESTRPTARRSSFFSPPTAPPGKSSVTKLLLGILFLFVGGGIVYVAGQEAWSAWKVSQRQATEVTAAELARPDFAKSAPEWIRYTFGELKPTAVAVQRKRSGGGVEVEARCYLVRVGDKWLLATVPPGFQETELVGSVAPFDPTTSRPMLEQVARAEPKVTAILPFEFNGVEGCATDQRRRQTAAGILATLGLLSVLLGVYLLPFGAKPPVQPAAPPGIADQVAGLDTARLFK